MAGPFDYNIQQPDIAGTLLGGIKAGGQVREQRVKREAAEAEALKQQQYSADLQAYLDNPSPRGAAAMSVKYPEQREAFKQSWDILGKDQQDSQFRSGTQVYSALQNGNPDAAKEILDRQITAMENTGQDASSFKSIRESIDRNPNGVAAQIGLTLSALEPEKWGKVANEMRESEIAPAKLSEAQSKAAKAAVDAKFAESAAAMDLEKAGWDIRKLQNDISIARQNSQIAAMNAATSREGNDLKRQELNFKLQEKIDKRDADLRDKVANVETARASIDNMLNTADRVLKTPFGIVGSAAGPISSRAPTLSQDTADLEELVNTLGSQAFMAQIPNLKGMGALSNAEGEKLQSALQNLSLRQSPERLLENVREAQRLMLKSRQTLADRYGVPDVIPDRPALETQPPSSGFKVLGVE